MIINNMKYLRKLENLSLEFVAKELGIDSKDYVRYEQSKFIPKELVNELSNFYSVPVQDIITKTEFPERELLKVLCLEKLLEDE